jgi:methylmalonyl-CoA mutase N-terminal domain/subunit
VTALRADYAPDAGEHPGEFPYTRGISAEPGPWIMGQYAGFGTAVETNGRFRALLDAGVTGFSVALDLPTQMGLDSDDPRVAGEVGKVGVAIDSLADIEALMEGIPLERISQVRTTANSIGYVWAAMFVALAEQRGLDPNAFGLFIQNDVLKEYIARGTQIFPGAFDCRWTLPSTWPTTFRAVLSPSAITSASLARCGPARLHCERRCIPRCCSRSGRRHRRRRTDALHLPVGGHRPAPGDVGFRAAVVFGPAPARAAHDPRSEQLRIFVFTAGSSLTAQQPLNNVVRATVEALAAALAGVQTMHVCAYDEAVGVPTEAAALLALRTQQIVAYETGLTSLDPLAARTPSRR